MRSSRTNTACEDPAATRAWMRDPEGIGSPKSSRASTPQSRVAYGVPLRFRRLRNRSPGGKQLVERETAASRA
jgi:hypothetical protein